MAHRTIQLSTIVFLLSSVYTMYIHTSHKDMPITNDLYLMSLFEQSKATVNSFRQQWRPVQEHSRDTVVQIFCQSGELDILQPYKTPTVCTYRGSGFFINDQGAIITNAHVVDQALALWVQIPSLGKKDIDVFVVGVCPDRDIALLQVSEKDLAVIRAELGTIPFLMLGDSDTVRRADEVLTIGYPLGQESIKSTAGIISGREKNMIQISAPINPGNSGGPLLNMEGEVVGIATSGITEAQNIGYAIPINDLKVILPALKNIPLLRKPFMGIIAANATDTLTEFLGNPQPGGCFVVEVIKDSPLHKAGLKLGDMIYAVNGHTIDIFSEMTVPWSEDKISISNYISRLAVGTPIELLVYRSGVPLTMNVQLDYSALLPIRRMHIGYEQCDYEIIGGMVVMELTLNHIERLINHAQGLARYLEMQHQTESVLVITHIFPTSHLFRSRTLMPGFTLHEVNGQAVKTVMDFRNAVAQSLTSQYLTLKASDMVNKLSDNIFVVLPFHKILQEEKSLARAFHYPISDFTRSLIKSTLLDV